MPDITRADCTRVQERIEVRTASNGFDHLSSLLKGFEPAEVQVSFLIGHHGGSAGAHGQARAHRAWPIPLRLCQLMQAESQTLGIGAVAESPEPRLVRNEVFRGSAKGTHVRDSSLDILHPKVRHRASRIVAVQPNLASWRLEPAATRRCFGRHGVKRPTQYCFASSPFPGIICF
ncbi:hypothetical protein [Burkholderia stagnalis]